MRLIIFLSTLMCMQLLYVGLAQEALYAGNTWIVLPDGSVKSSRGPYEGNTEIRKNVPYQDPILKKGPYSSDEKIRIGPQAVPEIFRDPMQEMDNPPPTQTPPRPED